MKVLHSICQLDGDVLVDEAKTEVSHGPEYATKGWET